MSMDDVFKSGEGAGFSDAQFEAMMKDRAAARNARYGLIALFGVLTIIGAIVVVGIMAAGGAFSG